MIGAVTDGIMGGGDALLVTGSRPFGAHAGGHDQLAARLRQGADQRGLLRAGDNAVGPGLKCAGGAFQRDLAQITRADQVGIQIGAVKRGQDRDRKDPGVRSRPPLGSRAHHLWVAMHGQKIKVILHKAAHGSLDGGTDVEQFHVQKDALAVFLFQLVGEGKAATRQHAKADLVEADRIPDPPGKVETLNDIGHIKGNDQTVIRHGGLRVHKGASCGVGVKVSSHAAGGCAMILCFDIGGSRIKAAAFADGQMTALGDAPTPRDDFAAFVGVLRQFARGFAPKGIAISIAGVIDADTRRISVANIPCAHDRLLEHEIASALGLPTLILNDADAFALAEAHLGAGRGHRNVFGVILGTGVGGGLVIDGRLIAGTGGFAGEWGHGPVIAAPWDFLCGCGLRGCVDAVGGARGMEKLHLTLHGVAAPSTAILADWQAGDPRASATIAKWLDLVAPPLALVVNVTGASSLPVGGGLANVAALVAALDARVRAFILRKTRVPMVVPATCGPEAGLIGAAEAGRERFGT